MPDAKELRKTHRIASIDVDSVKQSNEHQQCHACGKGVTQRRPLVQACLQSLFVRDSYIAWVCFMCLKRTFHFNDEMLAVAQQNYNRAQNTVHYDTFFRFLAQCPDLVAHPAIARAHETHTSGRSLLPKVMSNVMCVLWTYAQDADLRDNMLWLASQGSEQADVSRAVRDAHLGIPTWPSRDDIESVKRLRIILSGPLGAVTTQTLE